MHKKTALLFSLEAIALAVVIFLLTPLSGNVLSAVNHIVISEVQLSGATSDDEFIELYNPTNEAVDLAGWRLARRTANDTDDTNNLVASMSGTIPAHGYFLIAHPDYSGTVQEDLNYSATSSALALNNAVLLYRDEDGIETVEDKVGLGTSINSETSSISNPPTSGSVERKAKTSSTLESMTTGADLLMGNGEDSDNNLNDFIVRSVSDAQNSSTTETLVIETFSPTPTISPSPTESPSPTPTESPSPTPSPIESPTPIPTESPTPTPTELPTPSPTASSSPTSSPTSAPTVTPTGTPRVLGTFKFPGVTCRMEDSYVNFGFIKFRSPRIVCSWL